jgi:hypothetical protein
MTYLSLRLSFGIQASEFCPFLEVILDLATNLPYVRKRKARFVTKQRKPLNGLMRVLT